MTFHQLYHGICPDLLDLGLEWNEIQSWMGLEWNGIQSWVVWIDPTQMHLLGGHEASPVHFEFEHFVLGALQNSICISSSPLWKTVPWDRMCFWSWATQLISCDLVGVRIDWPKSLIEADPWPEAPAWASSKAHQGR